MERVDSHKDKTKGRHQTTKSGNYVFTWDNTYSAMRKKELTYKVTNYNSTYPNDQLANTT